MIPGAIEMMDRLILKAVEAAFHVGFSPDAGAVLIVELDGLEVGLDERAAAAIELMRSCGVTEAKLARDEAERALLWKARKRAFGAVGRLAPNYATQDGVVPRTRLPDILRVIHAVASATASRSETSFTPATATSIRSCFMMSAIAGPGAACDRSGPRNPDRMRRDGWQSDRRAWHRGREDGRNAVAVFARRFDCDGGAAPRLRSRRAIESPQGDSHSRRMRRSYFASKASPSVSTMFEDARRDRRY